MTFKPPRTIGFGHGMQGNFHVEEAPEEGKQKKDKNLLANPPKPKRKPEMVKKRDCRSIQQELETVRQAYEFQKNEVRNLKNKADSLGNRHKDALRKVGSLFKEKTQNNILRSRRITGAFSDLNKKVEAAQKHADKLKKEFRRQESALLGQAVKLRELKNKLEKIQNQLNLCRNGR